MLVNFQTSPQRLIDQVAVPRDTKEKATLADLLSKMSWAGIIGEAVY